MTDPLAIRGGTIVGDAAGTHRDVIARDGRITSLGVKPGDEPGDDGSIRAVLDATACTVLPGFVDVQLNGGWGVDFTTEPGRMQEVAARLPGTGVTAFLPTVITSPTAITARAVAELSAALSRTRGAARPLGVHLEGPYLDPTRKGAHPPQHLRPPSTAEAARWSASGGVAMVTLAPELEGALEVIALLVSNGVVVCAGHTAANARELQLAVDAGVTGATHLYNAMGPFGGREPGTVGPLLAHRSLITGLIVDGLHVDPIMVDVAWRARGPHGIALVTDAITALGAGHGRYSIGDTEIIVDDTGARTATGILAGSVLRMDQAVRNLMAFTGCSLAEASLSASGTPADLLRRSDVGRLRVGAFADVILLDDRCEVVATVIDGEVVYDPQQRQVP